MTPYGHCTSEELYLRDGVCLRSGFLGNELRDVGGLTGSECGTDTKGSEASRTGQSKQLGCDVAATQSQPGQARDNPAGWSFSPN